MPTRRGLTRDAEAEERSRKARVRNFVKLVKQGADGLAATGKKQSGQEQPTGPDQ